TRSYPGVGEADPPRLERRRDVRLCGLAELSHRPVADGRVRPAAASLGGVAFLAEVREHLVASCLFGFGGGATFDLFRLQLNEIGEPAAFQRGGLFVWGHGSGRLAYARQGREPVVDFGLIEADP